MISKRVEEALNHQINNELASYYSYLGMVAFLESTPYKGFATWMRLQAEEEQVHAMKIFDYLNDRGGKVVLQAVIQPQTDYSSPLEIFSNSLEQEIEVTSQINDLFLLAQEEKDFTTLEFLGWFLTEQVEEEKSAQDMVDLLELAKDSVNALLRIDSQAGQRSLVGSQA